MLRSDKMGSKEMQMRCNTCRDRQQFRGWQKEKYSVFTMQRVYDRSHLSRVDPNNILTRSIIFWDQPKLQREVFDILEERTSHEASLAMKIVHRKNIRKFHSTIKIMNKEVHYSEIHSQRISSKVDTAIPHNDVAVGM